MSEKATKLFSEFPEISTKEWEEKIKIDLKGADYDRKLITKTLDNINIKPYYRDENLEGLEYLDVLPGEFPYVRGNRTFENTSNIRQDILVKSYSEANIYAKDILNKGVDSLGFDLSEKKEITESDISTLLEGIFIENIEINFIASENHKQILDLYIDYISKNNLDKEKICGSINFDPLLQKTIKGSDVNFNKNFIENNELPNFKILQISGYYFRNAGASSIQELAFSLSVANDYLVKYKELGVDIEKLIPRIAFSFATGSNYFFEIAKLRVARLLWAKIVETHIPENKEIAKAHIHATTLSFNKTKYDPYVNVLRSTTEAMSAIIGACDSLSIIPHNFDKNDAFAGRIARNIQIILKEEAYFDKAIDPASGSYYIENITNSMAENVWNLFIEIEEKGGYLEALKQNFVQNEIEKFAEKRKLNVATGKETLLGTNKFPNKTEKLVVNNKKRTSKNNNEIKTLNIFRASEDFENLRTSVEQSSKTPKVFMLTYGNLAMRKARATFAGNFFACAGFEIIDNFGFETISEGIEASKKANADIIVFCSSDDEYENINESNIKELADKTIAVAGYPKNLLEKLQSFGIEYFVHVKSNILETLTSISKKI